MIKYDLDFINKISSTIDIKSLDNSILKILQDIDNEINISFSNENSIYNKKKYKKRNENCSEYYTSRYNRKQLVNRITNNTSENNIVNDDNNYTHSYNVTKDNNIIENDSSINKLTFNIDRIRIKNSKSELENIIERIRKLLNKISNTNFNKIVTEFMCLYNVYLDSSSSNDIDIINNTIFDIITSNIFFSDIYIKFYIELQNNYPLIKELINNSINKLYINIDNLKIYCSNNDDELAKINKENDKIKAFVIFYINLYVNGYIDYKIIIDYIYYIQSKLLDYIDRENKKILCEELTNILFLIIDKSYLSLKLNKEYDIIYRNIEYISKLKVNDKPSISNKIIFKHKDLYEKYKLL